MKRTAQVHRFGDKVAIFVGNGQTVYLTPAQARKIAKALNAAVRDINAENFTFSNFPATSIHLDDTP